jgi:flavorubredoxin
MTTRQIAPGIYDVGVYHTDLRFFDRLMPTYSGTTYNSYFLDGGEKTLLIDPVDPVLAEEHLANLRTIGVKKIDGIACLHTEQDHAGSVETLLSHFPEAKVVVTKRVFDLMKAHFRVPEDQYRIVEDGDVLEVGRFRLTVKSTPFAHWPDNTMLLLESPRFVFSSDLFGSHYSEPDVSARDPEIQIDQAKAYYAEIMMPFRSHVAKYTAYVREFKPEKILPSHGPVWDDPSLILDRYDDWTGDAVCPRVVVFYCSMHESTRFMVERLSQRLAAHGVKVSAHDLGADDCDLRESAGNGMHRAVKAAAIVFATPTVLYGPHPNIAFAAVLANALKPKARYLSLIGSYGWGTQVEKVMKTLLSGLKAEWLDSVLIKGLPFEHELEPIDRLADDLAEKVMAVSELE